MLPDAGVDQQISLTGRLSARAQSLHDLIGLDDAVLQQTERVNWDSIYAIYDGELPEQDDALDSIAAAPEANALLNRVRRERPELWRRRINMLDGRRAARVADASARLAAGMTLALTVSEGVKQGFRVAADLTAHPWGHAGATRLTQWEPGVPAAALPPDINRRVKAALTAAGRKRLPPRRNRQSESRPMSAASRGNWGNCV